MNEAITLKLRPVEPIRVERIAQRPILIERTSQAAPQLRLGDVQVIEIVGYGPPGEAGPPGPAGDGVADPGDLTLYFENGLT